MERRSDPLDVKFGEVVARSAYGTIGYVEKPGDVALLERNLRHNWPVLEAFRTVLVATNYGGESSRELAALNAEAWRRHVPGCVLLDSPVNRGHSIGTSDLDNLLFDHCKANGIDWLCKGANDVLLGPPVLNIEVETADFYFLNAVSCRALRGLDVDLETIGPGFFFPQTNFYAIDVGRTDFLVDKELLDRSYAIVNRIPGYNGRIWEHIPGWSCESLLRKCVLRNRLTRCHLMDADQFTRLLRLVRERGIEDCSLKNLTINGICHFHADAVSAHLPAANVPASG